VSLLGQILRPEDQGLEWGAGRSTPWLAGRLGSLTSVEHDPEWSLRVQGMLDRAGVADGVRLVLAEDGVDERSDSRYVRVASEFADESLDFCLVDGMARDHCALRVLDKLRLGGILVIDNVNWYLPRHPRSRAPGSRSMSEGPATREWAEVSERLRAWRGIWTTDGITDTALWIRCD